MSIMFSFKILIAAVIAQLVQAQEASPEYVNIVAGESPMMFEHPQVPAGINDVIIWSFVTGGNHSVIQSTYENPCHYLPGGFYSGFQSVPPRPEGGSGIGPYQFRVTINSTDPIYYYCGQIGHCQAGMVGVINPPCDQGDGIYATGSFNDYKRLAMAVTSVGPLPSVIMGGELVPSSYPTSPPPGSAGPWYSGFSASCTAGLNSSSNSTESTITSITTSAATSTKSSTLQSISSSEGGSVHSTESTTTSSVTSVATSTPSSSVTSAATSTSSSTLQPISSSSGGRVNPTNSTVSSTTKSSETSTTSSGIQTTSSSGSGSVYGNILSRNQDLPGLIWQAGSRLGFGFIATVVCALIIL